MCICVFIKTRKTLVERVVTQNKDQHKPTLLSRVKLLSRWAVLNQDLHTDAITQSIFYSDQAFILIFFSFFFVHVNITSVDLEKASHVGSSGL